MPRNSARGACRADFEETPPAAATITKHGGFTWRPASEQSGFPSRPKVISALANRSSCADWIGCAACPHNRHGHGSCFALRRNRGRLENLFTGGLCRRDDQGRMALVDVAIRGFRGTTALFRTRTAGPIPSNRFRFGSICRTPSYRRLGWKNSLRSAGLVFSIIHRDTPSQ